jgi:glucose/arabinose dehydrogenase
MIRRRPRIAPLTLVTAFALGLPAAAAAQGPYPARVVDGTIARVAGTTAGFAGDGGPATAAQMNAPLDTTFLPDGSYLIADSVNNRIRRVRTDGVIQTVAGNGGAGVGGDARPAVAAQMTRPGGVTALSTGGYLIADTLNGRIRVVSPAGVIGTAAGTTPGFSGDGGPAGIAQLSAPSDTAVMPDGGYVIADTGNNRIRRVSPAGVITTVAGSTAGFSGDGGPAAAAQLNTPRDVAVAVDGSIVVADTGNSRIRRIAPDGTISTVAGTGPPGFTGDGDPARGAQLSSPVSVAALPNGGVLVADTANSRVRRITPLGAIFTVAGTTPGAGGDGGPSKAGQLNGPAGVTPAPGGGFLVADAGNARIRRVSTVGAVPPAVSGRSVGVVPQSGTITVQPAGIQAFLPLREEDLVPLTSDVDATTGRLQIATAVGFGPAQQTAVTREGSFNVRQIGPGASPTTLLRLPSLTGCGSAARATATATAKRRKRSKRLWVSEKGGRWRTATGSVSAAAIGTEWATTLLCDGTRVSVREGAVRVRDKIRNRSVIVRAGQSFKVATRGARRGS